MKESLCKSAYMRVFCCTVICYFASFLFFTHAHITLFDFHWNIFGSTKKCVNSCLRTLFVCVANKLTYISKPFLQAPRCVQPSSFLASLFRYISHWMLNKLSLYDSSLSSAVIWKAAVMSLKLSLPLFQVIKIHESNSSFTRTQPNLSTDSHTSVAYWSIHSM